MLILMLCVLALLSPILFGGSLARFGLVRFRGWWVVVAALLAQILIIEIFPDADRALLEAVHIGTYVAAGVFVAVNWDTPGLLLIAAGGAMNGITIALNGGQLPASPDALRMAGIDAAAGDFVNSGALAHPVLPLLGDIFAWPEPFPFANVFSFGDVLIVAGTFYGAQKITGSRLVKNPWRTGEERAEEAVPLSADPSVPGETPATSEGVEPDALEDASTQSARPSARPSAHPGARPGAHPGARPVADRV